MSTLAFLGFHWYEIFPIALLSLILLFIVLGVRAFWRGLRRGLLDE